MHCNEIKKTIGFLQLWIAAAFFATVFSLTAWAADRTVAFSTSDPGQDKNISNWGVDSAWEDYNNMRRNIIFMGDACENVRVRPRKEQALVGSSGDLFTYELSASEKQTISDKLDRINSYKSDLTWYFYSDAEQTDAWYISEENRLHPDRIAAMWSANVRYLQSLPNAPEIGWLDLANEPDLGGTPTGGSPNQGSSQDYYDALGYMNGRSEFSGMFMGGLGVLNSDVAFDWFDPIRSRATLGSMHNLAGACSEYVAFLQSCSTIETFEPEVHNVGECIIGAEYGLDGVIWWGGAALARGEFAKAAKFGKRLGYAEHMDNWTAAAVYRHADGRVQGFVGEAERTCLPTTYEFYCTDRPVFFDGYGPQRSYVVQTSGAEGYATEYHQNAERVVNISWGDDVQRPVAAGCYVLVNRHSGKVMEVANSSAADGANIQQNAYTGGSNQQWDIQPVEFTCYGDWSYFKVTAAHSGKAADVYGFAYDNGGNITQWTHNAESENQQWRFDYVEDGWFYIRSKWNKKCLYVANMSTANGANIQQWEPSGGYNQMWRLLPVGAAIEFDAPAAPTGVVAADNMGSVGLSWNANAESDLAGYTVLRSTLSEGPYEIIGRGITGTSFTDDEVIQFVPYYYVIKAVDESLNRSANSAQVTATPTGVPAGAIYDFDGDANDSSGNNNHGSTSGSPVYVSGVYDQAIDLDGSTDFVTLPGGIANSDDITVTAWINWDGGDAWQRIFDFGNDTNYNMFLTPASGDGTLRFAIKNGGSEQITETAVLPTGIWVHVAIRLNGDTATLYLDGAAVASNSATTIKPSDFNPTNNYIGDSQWPDPLFNGRIDDFRIYNIALSDAQIAAIVSANTPPLFTSDVFSNSTGIELSEYAGQSLAGFVIDPDSDVITFSKDSGPEWLTVASDGALSGIPLDANVGANVFDARVTNSLGQYDMAQMTIDVANVYSGIRGLEDLAGLATQWLAADCVDTPACNGADLSGDQAVDMDDIAVLSHNWLADESLQLHLGFDQTSGTVAADSSVYARSGDLINGPVWTSGQVGGALSFDGTDDYVQIPGYQGVTSTSARTICVWIKTDTTGAIMSWGSSTPVGGDYWYMLVNYASSGTPGALHVSVHGGNAVGTTDLRDGQWHHIAVVMDNDGSPNASELLMYVDGQPETLSYVASKAINTAADSDVYIASRFGGTSNLFTGLIDEVKIYDVALAEQEIQAIANP